MSPLNPREREWVYFLEADIPIPLVKIGKTSDVKWRVLTLQHMSPVTLGLVGIVSGPVGTESVMHRMFAAKRMHGEWFTLDDELRTFIGSLPKAGPLRSEQIGAWAVTHGVNLEAAKVKGLLRKKQRRKDVFGQWEIPVRARKY